MNNISEMRLPDPSLRRASSGAPRHYGWALFALAAAAFGIGTTEFVIMGLLPDVARDLAVTIPQAGLLVTGYALGVTFGGPVLALMTAKADRRKALLFLIGIFITGNLLCAVAPTYALLMAARVVTAVCHGTFFGLGAVVAASIVPPKMRARAIAMMFSGLTLANVLGVPFGTALGQALGWRATFWAVVAIGVVAATALAVWLPCNIPNQSTSLIAEARTLRRAGVWLAMSISTVSSVALFAVFTYIAPILQDVTGVSAHGVTIMLLLFGAGLTAGNAVGGRLGDWKLMPTLIGGTVALIAIQLVFHWSAVSMIPAGITIFLWGFLVFLIIPSIQMQVLHAARGAPTLASTLNQSAFNLGNASGAWLGGAAINVGVGYGELPLIGAAASLVGLGVVLATVLQDRRARKAAAAHDDAPPAAASACAAE
ncbi:MFS transporter [Dongia sedimenti]|uniref:MFS transporter n=1 Tax=Dongia sedimenti TaxID=3064282 RepID=A0ABU0YLP6_9PROT|nr:MFS transporter [Rhodospirillaceae bacterium R-7]